jgi:hypothetical protein
MGWLTNLVKVVAPIVKSVPGVGTALGVFGAYKAATGILGGGGGGGGPPPMLLPPGAGGGMGGFDPRMGQRSIFRDDPNVAERLKAYAIDNRFLKQYWRGPKGFVVLKDAKGDAFAIPKKLAIAEKMWKQGKKPPISVGDWSHLQGANRVVKKFRSMEKMAMKIANFRAPHGRKSQLKLYEAPGQIKIGRKAA